MAHSVKDVIDGYIRLRDKRDALRRRHAEEMSPYSEKMATMENWLLGELTKTGGDSIAKKGVGTVFKSIRTISKVQDWDVALPFILDNGLEHLLERRVSKAGLEEYIEANGEPIPGVSIAREIVVNVRRNPS